MQKSQKVRTERLKLYTAAVDLIRNSRHDPETVIERNNPGLLLHRFYGVTKDGVEYCVQIKQNKRTGRLDLMSAFKKKCDEKQKTLRVVA